MITKIITNKRRFVGSFFPVFFGSFLGVSLAVALEKVVFDVSGFCGVEGFGGGPLFSGS